MKHVLTLKEIATACSEYVVNRHYSVDDLWDAEANIGTVKVDPTKIPGATWTSDFAEGVVISVSIEVKRHEEDPKT